MFGLWQLSQETERRLSEVDEALRRLIDVGDFTSETITEIARMSIPDRISDTLAIESIVVGRRVTTAVLQGNALNDVDSYTKQAILNVNEANEYIYNQAQAGTDLDQEVLRQINLRIIRDLGEVSNPGQFRNTNVQITGAEIQPPWWSDIPSMLEDGLTLLRVQELHPIHLAAYAHWLVAHVHPFENGNGRTARMVQDLLLIASRYLPVGIPQAKRASYYEALADADSGDGNELVQMIALAELDIIQRTIEVGQQQVKRQASVEQLLDKILRAGKASEVSHFESWSRKVETFRKLLVEDFNTINSGSMGFVKFRHWTEPMPTQEEWHEISNNGRPWNKQLLRFEVSGQQGFFFKGCLYVKRHDMRDALEPTRQFRNEVAIFIDIKDDRDARYDYHRPTDDPFVTTRELVVTEKNWTVFSDQSLLADFLPEDVNVQLSSNKWLAKEVASSAEVISDLIGQIQQKMGI